MGQLRRKKALEKQQQSVKFVLNLKHRKAQPADIREGVKEDHGADYFSHSNDDAMKKRDALAEESLEMLIKWLQDDGGNVGIHGKYVSYAIGKYR